MLVFRITLSIYADRLHASGRPARWNSNNIHVIYTACSRSLACLENIVHRSQLGLSANFSVLIIEIPDALEIQVLDRTSLPESWNTLQMFSKTQAIGNQWILDNKTAVLQIPSSIIPLESNFLINPNHRDFTSIKLVQAEPFYFDNRIKQ